MSAIDQALRDFEAIGQRVEAATLREGMTCTAQVASGRMDPAVRPLMYLLAAEADNMRETAALLADDPLAWVFRRDAEAAKERFERCWKRAGAA
jgi:hypothetical protein